MKEITNKNHTLTLCIDTWGAQPTALINQKGENVLWKGDSGYWEKHDPILFPTIGNCFGQQIRVEGVPYPMPKHGFAQRMPWKVVEESLNADGEGRLVLELTDTEESRRHYPFSFCIQQTFDVRNDNTLCVTWCVKSDVTLPFMMGAHPAFTLPDFREEDEVHGYLCLDTPQIVSHRVLPDGFLHEEVETVCLEAWEEGGQKVSSGYLLPLTNTTFTCDTLLDTRGMNQSVILLDKERKPILTLQHKMPVLALWAPKNGCCPFVCIEPWCGCCDAPGYEGEFSERPFVQKAVAGQEWSQSYHIKVHN